MSVENIHVIDTISVDTENRIVLTISDHLKWNNKHLVLLQNKINSYIDFIESGQIYEQYPDIKEEQIVISVATKYAPNKEAESFFKEVSKIFENLPYSFEYYQLQ
ncbi:MAG: hypothetical protein PHX54_11540 [Lentimicrobiaceae bacterium]|jgi:hypothetical protein|nr:hypothetical protein [Lentimicrobiaceae bacterium]